MNTIKKILVIGRHAEMLNRVTDMLQLHGYEAIGIQKNERAIETFKTNSIAAVLIGGGVDRESRHFFHTEFPKIQPSVKIIDAHPQTVLTDLQNVFS